MGKPKQPKADRDATIDAAQERILEETAHLTDWMARYEYLIELGKKFEAPSDLRIGENALQGCQSQVWLKAENREGKVHFWADSDSVITRGILSLLLRVLNDRSPREVSEADLYFIERLGLSRHLSPSRADGLGMIVKRMRLFSDESRRAPETQRSSDAQRP